MKTLYRIVKQVSGNKPYRIDFKTHKDWCHSGVFFRTYQESLLFVEQQKEKEPQEGEIVYEDIE